MLELSVIEVAHEIAHRLACVNEELVADVSTLQREQLLIRLVRHRVDVRLECVSMRLGKRRCEPASVFRFGDVPSGVGEEALTAMSFNRPMELFFSPNKSATLVRCKLAVNEGKVTSTWFVKEFWAWRALTARLIGFPGNDFDHCTLDWNVLDKKSC